MALGVQDYELRWFIEVDRSSESLPVVVRKCRLYADYYQSGNEQAAHGGVFPRVCWVVPMKSARSRSERYSAGPAIAGRLFVVTTSEQALATLTARVDKAKEVTI